MFCRMCKHFALSLYNPLFIFYLPPNISTLFPYTTLFRSPRHRGGRDRAAGPVIDDRLLRRHAALGWGGIGIGTRSIARAAPRSEEHTSEPVTATSRMPSSA